MLNTDAKLDWFNEEFERIYDKLVDTASHLTCRTPHDPRDLVSETYLRLLDKLHLVDSDKPLFGYALSTMKSVFNNKFRKIRFDTPFSALPYEPAYEPSYNEGAEPLGSVSLEILTPYERRLLNNNPLDEIDESFKQRIRLRYELNLRPIISPILDGDGYYEYGFVPPHNLEDAEPLRSPISIPLRLIAIHHPCVMATYNEGVLRVGETSLTETRRYCLDNPDKLEEWGHDYPVILEVRP